MPKVITLPGDGIGPEVTAAAVEVLREVAPDVTVEERPIGGVAYDAHGDPFPQVTRDALKEADAVLLGTVGGAHDSACAVHGLPIDRAAATALRLWRRSSSLK